MYHFSFVFMIYATNLYLSQALGKTGKIIKIYPDGDLRVALDGPTWTFNPLSVVPVSPVSTNATTAAYDNANRFKDRLGIPIF